MASVHPAMRLHKFPTAGHSIHNTETRRKLRSIAEHMPHFDCRDSTCPQDLQNFADLLEKLLEDN